jgi:hypothetical protein
MRLGQRRRRLFGGFLTLGITYGFLWTDISQWGEVLLRIEAIFKPLFSG